MAKRKTHGWLLCTLISALALGCGDDGTKKPQTDGAAELDGAGDLDRADAGADAPSDSRADTDADTGDASVPEVDAISNITETCPDPCVLYVDQSAAAGGDGLTAATAFTEVQPGIELAYYTGGPGCVCEVRVAAGTYHIFKNDPQNTVRLRPGVKVLGGYPRGFSGGRDLEANPTILSGWQAGSEPQPVPDGGMAADAGAASAGDAGAGALARVYHVVTGCDQSTLDGFIIRGGYAVDDQVFSNPHNFGGGVFNAGASPVLKSLTFTDNEAVYGGAIYNGNASPTIDRCRFWDNSAVESGGAMDNRSLAAPQVTNCQFRNNAAPMGGAVHNRAYATPTFVGCQFENNSATWGGAVANDAHGDAVIETSVFNENSASTRGGAVFSRQSNPSITGCFFNDNAADGGGGVSWEEGGGSLDQCSFSGNSATKGGGLYLWTGANPQVTSSVFENNTAVNRGAGAFVDSQVVSVLDGCTFRDNAGDRGGAVAVDDSPIVLVNSVLNNNTAATAGGGVYMEVGSPKIINCTLVGNTANSGSAMRAVNGSSPEVTNCVIWKEGLRRQPLLDTDASSTFTVTYSCLDGGCERDLGCTTDNTGNIKLYTFPFINSADFRLQPGSVCAEAGNSAAVADYAVDYAGNPRLAENGDGGEAVVDMGAYECQGDCLCDPQTDSCCQPDGHACHYGCTIQGQCYPDCNPTLNGCCHEDGTLADGVWGDESTGYCWEHPTTGDLNQFKRIVVPDEGGPDYAYSYCLDLELGGFTNWAVPTIDDLRSLTRFRPSIYNNPVSGESGACAIYSGCTTSCSSEACTYSNDYPEGKYWPDALGSVPTNDAGILWANSVFSCPSNPGAAGCKNWAVDFRYGGIVVGGWGGSISVNDRYAVRCMRK